MTNTEYQKGVALLFALGILSLILVMGLAFLGNSLISQKIAFNNQESASSRFYARSAVDRALAHLTLFNLIQARDHATYYASDASSVFSRIDAAQSSIAGGSQTTGSSAAAKSQDQLSGADSKLNVEKKYNTPWYAGQDSAAKWIYIHRNGVESNGDTTSNTSNPIIARYAYQVLPQTSRSRLSLYGVTSGVTGIAGITPAASNPRIPHTHRWGMDVDELVVPGIGNMFSHYWGTGAASALAPQYEFDNFINLLAGSSTPNPFHGNTREVENRKRWLRNIFVEGKGRVAREAYTDGYNWYPRFNLGRRSGGSDPWYSRFLRSGEAESVFEVGGVAPKNSKEILDRLTSVPDDSNAIYKFDDSKVRDSDYTAQAGHNGIGLPFLRSIGDAGTGLADAQKGAFAEIGNLRKQIAANLNDYCDSDSVPTSNIPASEWKNKVAVIADGDLPGYTGNEKTPYINEVGFGFKLHDSSLGSSGSEYLFKTDIHAAVFAELINIYPGLTISSATLSGLLKKLSVTLEVAVSGNVAAGTYMKDGNPTNYDGFEFTDAKKEGAFNFIIPAEGKAFEINFGSGNKKGSGGSDGPYWVNLNKIFDRPSSGKNVSETIDLAKEIFKQEPGGDFVSGDSWSKTPSSISVTVSSVKVRVKKVTFDLGNLVLEMPSGTGVDFVKVESGDRTLASSEENGKEVLAVATTSELNTQTADGKGYFYAGSMQAIDPRQNLHAKINNVADATNEWHSSFEATVGVEGATTVPTWDDMTGSDSAAGTVAGRVNICSKPNAPLYSDGTTAIGDNVRDAETVVQPEYKSGTAPQMISTAVIRNAPMRSPWELGFIHRGILFQTINLKKAGGIDGFASLDDATHDAGNFANWTEPRGTRYEHGDGGILDQIKMTEYNKSYGKVDMSSLRVGNPAWWISSASENIDALNRSIFKSLFENMRTQTAAQFLEESANFETVPAPPEPPATSSWLGSVISPNPVTDDFTMSNIPGKKLRSQIFNDMAGVFVAGDNDAAREERIGKTVNLIEAESCSLPNVFRIVVVAQTVRDLGGTVARFDSSDTVQNETATLGKFDVNIGAALDSSIYYDEILSECRMLVTVEKIHYMEGNTPRARLRVKQIEYLD